MNADTTSHEMTHTSRAVYKLLHTLGHDPHNVTAIYIDPEWTTIVTNALDDEGNKILGSDGRHYLRDIITLPMKRTNTGVIQWRTQD